MKPKGSREICSNETNFIKAILMTILLFIMFLIFNYHLAQIVRNKYENTDNNYSADHFLFH